VTQSIPLQGKARLTFPWIFNQKLDLLFFFLPVILAPLMLMLAQSSFAVNSAFWGILIINSFGLGDFHVGATWFNYFDRKNRSFYASSPAKIRIYYLIPAAIIPLTMFGVIYLPALTVFIYMAWSIQHLVQQNVGLLLLYHNHKQNEAIVGRTLEMRSLHAGAVFFSMIFAQRVLWPSAILSPIWVTIIAAVGLSFFALIIFYLRELFHKIRQGASLNVPALLFWCLAIFFFAPFALIGKGYTDAILVSNIMHWCQYIGLMYALSFRKYKKDQLKDLPWPRPLIIFVLMGAAMVALLMGIRTAIGPISLESSPWTIKALLGFVLGMGMIHYWQDAFMWRFREPFYRETVLTFLRRSD
jgi:hypothetical protein